MLGKLEKPKFKIAVLGCRTNQYEGQAFRDQLEAMGYEAAQEGEQAQVCIVNTCTVTEGADSSSRHSIRQLAVQNPGTQLLVTGCMAQRDPQSLASFPGITKIIPNADKEHLVQALFPEQEVPEFSIKHFEAHTRAFVKVQDGCDSYCTYCIIPYVRGRSQSRQIPDIVKECEALIASGYQEIVLTGINIGDFNGADETGSSCGLSDLVRAVDQLKGLKRLRISSIDPDEVDDDLLDAVLYGTNTCPSMHIVLQSGSNHVLKRMNRKYTRQIFLKTIERLRRLCPDFTFTTDIIVGFPGETDKDFEETLEVAREVCFSKVHMFPYSERPRTRAALYPSKVSQSVIKERKAELLRVSEEIAYRLRDRFIGRTLSVLTEHKEQDQTGKLFGHTANFLGVWLSDLELEPNQLVQVVLEKNTPEGFLGKVVSENGHRNEGGSCGS